MLATMAAMTLMEQEAREAPAVARRLATQCDNALGRVGAQIRALDPLTVVAVGRGSSGAAALFAKYVFETRLGLPTVSAAPSVHSIYGTKLRLERALVLAISQSGRSPDLVEFCKHATGPGVLRLALVNEIDSPLVAAVDTALPLLAGRELSIAATKSCIAAMTLVVGLAGAWRPDSRLTVAFQRAPTVLDAALRSDWGAAAGFLDRDGPVYVVGRGPGLAIAAEAALKLKETCGLHAEAVSAAEIRHGPYALAGPALRAIIFAQRDASLAGISALVTDLRLRGASVLVISPDATLSSVHATADEEPLLELVGMLTSFYLFANTAALRRGRSPDQPPMLNKVTETH